MFLNWLKQAAKNAVLNGVVEALDELDRDATPADVDAARKRFAVAPEQKQLPAADEGEPGGKKRKAG
jgi:hypothetical protein